MKPNERLNRRIKNRPIKKRSSPSKKATTIPLKLPQRPHPNSEQKEPTQPTSPDTTPTPLSALRSTFVCRRIKSNAQTSSPKIDRVFQIP
jgi:hypothetical protein